MYSRGSLGLFLKHPNLIQSIPEYLQDISRAYLKQCDNTLEHVWNIYRALRELFEYTCNSLRFFRNDFKVVFGCLWRYVDCFPSISNLQLERNNSLEFLFYTVQEGSNSNEVIARIVKERRLRWCRNSSCPVFTNLVEFLEVDIIQIIAITGIIKKIIVYPMQQKVRNNLITEEEIIQELLHQVTFPILNPRRSVRGNPFPITHVMSIAELIY